MQHDFLYLSFNIDDFREFVDTLVAALRQIEHIQPVIIKEARENVAEATESGP